MCLRSYAPGTIITFRLCFPIFLLCFSALVVCFIQKKLLLPVMIDEYTKNETERNEIVTLTKEVLYLTPSCLIDPTKLNTQLLIDYNYLKSNYLMMSRHVTSVSGMRRRHFQFVPGSCEPTLTVAIIIPARNRTNHLHILLGHLHPFLQKQLLRYQFYVVHQTGNFIFNKGRLMNTAFQYAVQDGEKSGHPYDCFIFHDVDLLPESELNFYRCGHQRNADETRPIYHLAHTIEKYFYKTLCCGITVGGVIAFTKEQYEAVNGYSNNYWGWGGEDDDMLRRIRQRKIPVQRTNSIGVSRYTMIYHTTDVLNQVNPNRHKILAGSESKISGLNNLRTRVVSVHYFPLYVNISVDVGHPR